MNRQQRALKRSLDLAIGIPLAIIASPLMALVAIAIRWRLGSPVLFRQQRPGLHGRPFSMIKFRTLTNARENNGDLRPDAERMTRLGWFLRSASLDELPEIWNVLRGEMSLVGPRPLLMQYLDRYTPEQMRRHDLPPGITGWAQVNGRNAIDWRTKFQFDVWYVDHWTFFLDLRILVLTGVKVLRREGIRSEGHATAPEFKGDDILPSHNATAVTGVEISSSAASLGIDASDRLESKKAA